MAGFQETLRRLAIFDEGFVTAGSGLDLAGTPALDPKVAALLQAGGVGGHRVVGGLPGMERVPGAGGGRDQGRDRRRAAGDRPGGRDGPGGLGRPGVATALEYDIEAALEEPDDH